MIRWTKDGKVDRTYWIDPQRLRIPEGNALEENRRTRDAMKLADDLADALDVAVAALRQAQDFWRASGSLTADDVQSNVDSALRQIGADHAD